MNYDNNDRQRTTTTEEKAKGAGFGIGAVIIAIVVAIGAYFMFNDKVDTPKSVGADVGNAATAVVDTTADVAKEVPQAGKDAVTAGDQPTTRPNTDGSTDKLDQK